MRYLFINKDEDFSGTVYLFEINKETNTYYDCKLISEFDSLNNTSIVFTKDKWIPIEANDFIIGDTNGESIEFKEPIKEIDILDTKGSGIFSRDFVGKNNLFEMIAENEHFFQIKRSKG